MERDFSNRDVFIIVPVYNEGLVLACTISGLLPLGYSIVVVDDGSSDHCVDDLSSLPVHRLRHIHPRLADRYA